MFVAVLSDNPELRNQFCNSLGKETSRNDLVFYSLDAAGKSISLVEPSHYPEKIQSLLYALSIADSVILLVDVIGPKVGELLVAVNSMKIENGLIISKIPLPLKGTVLEKYSIVPDAAAAKEKLLAYPVPSTGESVLALVHKTEAVKSIGNVAFGALKGGSIKKSDKLYLLPQGLDVEVRSLSANGSELEEAKSGNPLELAYKGELFDKGIIAPLRHGYEVGTVVNGHFNKSPFFKDEIKGRIHAYSNMQYVEGTVTDNDLTLLSPFAFEKGESILVIDTSNQKLRVAGVFQSKW